MLSAIYSTVIRCSFTLLYGVHSRFTLFPVYSTSQRFLLSCLVRSPEHVSTSALQVAEDAPRWFRQLNEVSRRCPVSVPLFKHEYGLHWPSVKIGAVHVAHTLEHTSVTTAGTFTRPSARGLWWPYLMTHYWTIGRPTLSYWWSTWPSIFSSKRTTSNGRLEHMPSWICKSRTFRQTSFSSFTTSSEITTRTLLVICTCNIAPVRPRLWPRLTIFIRLFFTELVSSEENRDILCTFISCNSLFFLVIFCSWHFPRLI